MNKSTDIRRNSRRIKALSVFMAFLMLALVLSQSFANINITVRGVDIRLNTRVSSLVNTNTEYSTKHAGSGVTKTDNADFSYKYTGKIKNSKVDMYDYLSDAEVILNSAVPDSSVAGGFTDPFTKLNAQISEGGGLISAVANNVTIQFRTNQIIRSAQVQFLANDWNIYSGYLNMNYELSYSSLEGKIYQYTFTDTYNNISARLSNNEIYRINFRVIAADGTEKYVHNSASGWQDEFQIRKGLCHCFHSNDLQSYGTGFVDGIADSITSCEYTTPLYFGFFVHDADQYTSGNKPDYNNFFWQANLALRNDTHASVQNLVDDQLGAGGALTQNGIELPYFSSAWADSHKDLGRDVMKYYETDSDGKDIVFPFYEILADAKDVKGNSSSSSSQKARFYQFNSEDVNLYFNKNGNYFQEKSSKINGGGHAGFFPFDELNSNGENNHCGLGAKFEMEFKLQSDGCVNALDADGTALETGADRIHTMFEFSGDDDLWVFIDGNLVLDMGGAHGQSSGLIDFADKKATVNSAIEFGQGGSDNLNPSGITHLDVEGNDFKSKLRAGSFDSNGNYVPSITHKMTIFYMERGMYESNLLIRFNYAIEANFTKMKVQEVTDFTPVNTGLLSQTKKAADNDVFRYKISNTGTTNDYVSDSGILYPTYDTYNRSDLGNGSTKLTGRDYTYDNVGDINALFLNVDIPNSSSDWDSNNAVIAAWIWTPGFTGTLFIGEKVNDPQRGHVYKFSGFPVTATNVIFLRMRPGAYETNDAGFPLDREDYVGQTYPGAEDYVWNRTSGRLQDGIVFTLGKGRLFLITDWGDSSTSVSSLGMDSSVSGLYRYIQIHYENNNFTPGTNANVKHAVSNTNYLWEDEQAALSGGNNDDIAGMTNKTDGEGRFSLMYGTAGRESSAEFEHQFKNHETAAQSVMEVIQYDALTTPDRSAAPVAALDSASARTVSGYYNSTVSLKDRESHDAAFNGSSDTPPAAGTNFTTLFNFAHSEDISDPSLAVFMTEIFTNTPKVGALSITKTLMNNVPADPNDEFTFTVRLTDVFGVAGNNVSDYSDIDIVIDGTVTKLTAGGKFSMKAGKTAVINGIPIGTNFEVTEDALSDKLQRKYVANETEYHKANADGTMSEDQFLDAGDEPLNKITGTIEEGNEAAGETPAYKATQNNTGFVVNVRINDYITLSKTDSDGNLITGSRTTYYLLRLKSGDAETAGSFESLYAADPEGVSNAFANATAMTAEDIMIELDDYVEAVCGPFQTNAEGKAIAYSSSIQDAYEALGNTEPFDYNGKYFFYEVQAPYGFKADNSLTYTDKRGNVHTKLVQVTDDNKTPEISYPNASSVSLTVHKTDTDGEGLEGGEFDLYYKDSVTHPTYSYNDPVTPPVPSPTVELNGGDPPEPTAVSVDSQTVTTTHYSYTPVSSPMPSSDETDWILPRSDNDYIYFRDYNTGTTHSGSTGDHAAFGNNDGQRSWIKTWFANNVYGQNTEIGYDHRFWIEAQFTKNGSGMVKYAVWERFVDKYNGRDVVIWKIQPPDGYNRVRFCLYDGSTCIRTTEEFAYVLGNIYTKTGINASDARWNYPVNKNANEHLSTSYSSGVGETAMDARLSGTTAMHQAKRYEATAQKVIFHCNSRTVWHNIHIQFFTGENGETPIGQGFPGYMMEPYAYANDEYRINGYLTYELTIPEGATYFQVNNGVNGGTYDYRTAKTKLHTAEDRDGYKNYNNYFKFSGGPVSVSGGHTYQLTEWTDNEIRSAGDKVRETYGDSEVESDYDYIYFRRPAGWGSNIYAYFYGGGDLRKDNWQRACYSIWPGVAAASADYSVSNADDTSHHSDIYAYSYTGELYSSTSGTYNANPETTFNYGGTVYKFRIPKGELKNYSKVIFNDGLSSRGGSHETSVIKYRAGYLYSLNNLSGEKYYDSSTADYQMRGDYLYVICNDSSVDNLHVQFYNSNGIQILQSGHGYIMQYAGTANGSRYFRIPIPSSAARFSLSNGKGSAKTALSDILRKVNEVPSSPAEKELQDYTTGGMVVTLSSGSITTDQPSFTVDTTVTETVTYQSVDADYQPRGDYIYIYDKVDKYGNTPPVFRFVDADGNAITDASSVYTALKHDFDESNGPNDRHRWYSIGIPVNAARFEINGSGKWLEVYTRVADANDPKTQGCFTEGNMYLETRKGGSEQVTYPTFTITADYKGTDNYGAGNARGDDLYLVVSDKNNWTNMRVTFYKSDGTVITNSSGDIGISPSYLGRLGYEPSRPVDGESTDDLNAVGDWFRIAIPKEAASFKVSSSGRDSESGEILRLLNDKTYHFRKDYTPGDMQYRIEDTASGIDHSLELIYPVFTEDPFYTLEDHEDINSSIPLPGGGVDSSAVESYKSAALPTPAEATAQNNSPVLYASPSDTMTYTWTEQRAGDGKIRFDYSSTDYIFMIDNGTKNLASGLAGYPYGDHYVLDEMHVEFFSDAEGNNAIGSSAPGYVMDNTGMTFTDGSSVYRIAVPEGANYFRINNGQDKDNTGTKNNKRSSEIKELKIDGLYRFVQADSDPAPSGNSDYIKEGGSVPDSLGTLDDPEYLLELVNKTDISTGEDDDVPPAYREIKLATIITGADGSQKYIKWLKPKPGSEFEVDEEYLDHTAEDVFPRSSVTEVRVKKLGEYYWEETVAPYGYSKSTERVEFTVTLDDAAAGTMVAEIVDEPLNGRVLLTKTARDPAHIVIDGESQTINIGDRLGADYGFLLYSGKYNAVTGEESGKLIGTIDGSDQHIGKIAKKKGQSVYYYIPDNAELTAEPYRSMLNSGEWETNAAHTDFDYFNCTYGGRVTVYAKDNYTLSEPKNIRALLTDDSGEISVLNLPYGDYYLEEMGAPNDSPYYVKPDQGWVNTAQVDTSQQHYLVTYTENEEFMRGYISDHLYSPQRHNRVSFSIGKNNSVAQAKQVECKNDSTKAYFFLFEHINERRPEEWGDPTFIFRIKQTHVYNFNYGTDGAVNDPQYTEVDDGREYLVALTVDDDGTVSVDRIFPECNGWYVENTFITNFSFITTINSNNDDSQYVNNCMFGLDRAGMLAVEPGKYTISCQTLSRYEYVQSCSFKGNSQSDSWLLSYFDSDKGEYLSCNDSGLTDSSSPDYGKMEINGEKLFGYRGWFYHSNYYNDAEDNSAIKYNNETIEELEVLPGESAEIHYYHKVAYYDKFSQVGTRINQFYTTNSNRVMTTVKGIRIEDYGNIPASGTQTVDVSGLRAYFIMSDGSEVKMTEAQKAELVLTYSRDDNNGQSFSDFAYSSPYITISNAEEYPNSVYTLRADYSINGTTFSTGFDIIFERVPPESTDYYIGQVVFRNDSQDSTNAGDESNVSYFEDTAGNSTVRTHAYGYTFIISDGSVYDIRHNGESIRQGGEALETAWAREVSSLTTRLNILEPYKTANAQHGGYSFGGSWVRLEPTGAAPSDMSFGSISGFFTAQLPSASSERLDDVVYAAHLVYTPRTA